MDVQSSVCDSIVGVHARIYAGIAQLVERHVANVIVVGSIPITRSSLQKYNNVL